MRIYHYSIMRIYHYSIMRIYHYYAMQHSILPTCPDGRPMRALLDGKASINAVDESGGTPLHKASSRP
ncbi:hypothetical protein T484DRAFT_1833418 [Baffinella frigidus]|nr:hypothetical protein T484DRAFT_1833418 [Cryptophyta sp. CCMP2293]